MPFLTALAIAAILPKDGPNPEQVRAAILKMQQSGDPGWRGTGLVPLDRTAAPVLLRLLPKIEAPWVFDAVASQLAAWDYKESIPVLISCLNLPIWLPRQSRHAAEGALSAWGWLGHNALIRGARGGPYQQRFLCAKVLAGECRARPEDARLTSLFLQLSASPSTDFRNVSIRALDNLSGRIDGWMEMHHPATMDNPRAFERLLAMTIDRDGGVARAAALAVHVWLWSRAQGVLGDLNMMDYNNVVTPAERKALPDLTVKRTFPFERAAALALLRYNHKPTADVVARLADGDPLVRRVAILFLRDQVTPELIPALKAITLRPEEASRRAAALVLGGTYSAASLELLTPLLHDLSPSVRTAAKQGIERIEGKNLR